MLYAFRNRRGQATVIEYAVLFFLVIAAITAMSTYLKRGVQARVRGARNYMWTQVQAEYGPHHGGRNAPVGYEPYYINTNSDRGGVSSTITSVAPWTNHEGQFTTNYASTTTTGMVSEVAPASDAQ